MAGGRPPPTPQANLRLRSHLLDHDKMIIPDPSVARAMLLSHLEQDHVFMRNLFSKTNWFLDQSHSLQEARVLLEQASIPLIMVAADLPGFDLNEFLAAVHLLPKPPFVFMIGKDDLWAEVLNLGAYDLLSRPLDQQEVLQAVSLAWLAWTKGTRDKSHPPSDDTEPLSPFDFSITFSPELSETQVRATLEALADYYRRCGGAGLRIEFELEDVFVGEPTHA